MKPLAPVTRTVPFDIEGILEKQKHIMKGGKRKGRN
jgi:hypothetical protein